MNRPRMMIDLPEIYQTALRLRALKNRKHLSEVLQDAIGFMYLQEVKEAARFISQRPTPKNKE